MNSDKDSAPYKGVTVMQGSSGKAVSIDFETYYSSKDGYSLKGMTPHQYVNDPRFDAYLVAIASESGERFTGRPQDFCWGSLKGATLVAHNAGFDGMVLKRLIELGQVDDFQYDLVCTADMVAYLCRPRNLKDSSKLLLGREMSKAVRTNMDGKHFSDVVNEGPKAVEALLNYAGDDAVNCLDLFLQYGDEFPQRERIISQRNREACWKGVAVDLEQVEEGLKKLGLVKWEAQRALPWVDEGRMAGSISALSAHAASLGLPIPKSFKKDDPEMMEWVAKYAPTNPFIKARLDLASVNPHIARLESLKNIAAADGIGRFSVLYFGTHTGRASGSAGAETSSSSKYNILNLPKAPVFGVDMRSMLKARDGHTFVIFDYAQIEARIVQWLAGNDAFLEIVRREGNMYQAAAKTMGWFPMDGVNLKKNDPKLYQLAKACLAPETLVLTESGYKRIVDITVTERVWDGQTWVTHEGVVCNGYKTEKELFCVNGERFTGDHEIYTGASSKLRADIIQIGDEASALVWRQATQPVAGWNDLGKLAYAIVRTLAKGFGTEYRVRMSRVRSRILPKCLQRQERKDNSMHGLCTEASTENVLGAPVGPDAGRTGLGNPGQVVRDSQ